MTLEQIIMTLLGLGCASLGWFSRIIYQATIDLRRDLSALEIQLAQDYIRYDRLKDALQPIMDSLTEIKSTLQHKVDK